MWWLISLAVSGAAYLIQQKLKEKAQAEHERWEGTYRQTLDRIRSQRQTIAARIKSARQYLDFHSLCDLHFVSVKVANEAYRLLHDAKVSETEIRKSIGDIKAKMEGIYRQTKSPGWSRCDQDALHSQLAELKQLKKTLFEAATTMSEQVKHFRAEVRQLNQETHDLKCAIRDRCGWHGTEWYNRLEARTRARRPRQFV